MKVEFCTNEANKLGELDDTILIIKASEFLKAKNNSREFRSLQNAVEAYCNLFCFEHIIKQDEYDSIVQIVKSEDTIIFSGNGIDTENEFTLDIYLKRKSLLLKIISND